MVFATAGFFAWTVGGGKRAVLRSAGNFDNTLRVSRKEAVNKFV